MLASASIFSNPPGGMEPSLHIGLKAWGHQQPRLDAREQWGALDARMTEDAAGHWLEVGFISPYRLDGSAATGWRQGNLAIWLQRSTDLLEWSDGHFLDCDGSPESVADGWRYWSRAKVPRLWYSVMCDLTATSDRYGKTITAITARRSPISLSYPYAMPGDAATLQADLRSAGFAGALVSSTSAAIVATARNHTPFGTFQIRLTMSSDDVTAAADVAYNPISLPSAPYAMPGQRAALQADLRAAGQGGAVVMLHQDIWSVFLPDLTAGADDRDFSMTIGPGDPFPVWDFFGSYVGLNPNSTVLGSCGNVRDHTGNILSEVPNQFARIAFRHRS